MELITGGYSPTTPNIQGYQLNALFNQIIANINYSRSKGLGFWESSKAYYATVNEFDIVRHESKIYYALQDSNLDGVSAKSPSTNPDYWGVMFDFGTPNFGSVPIGGIIMYDGLLTALPSNWKVCDGLNGTPDLVDKFIFGTNVQVDMLLSGGSKDAVLPAHTHTADHTHTGSLTSSGAHTHPIGVGGSGAAVNCSSGYGSIMASSSGVTCSNNAHALSSGAHTHSMTINSASVTTSSAGVTATDKNLPPYVRLAYIKRVA